MDGKPSLDPIDVASLLLSIFLSQRLASVVGPYALIILSAMGGAALRIGNKKEPDTWAKTILFFFGATVLGTFTAVPASFMIAGWNDKLEAQWLFVPVAAGMAYATDRIPGLLNIGLESVRSLVRDWANKNKRDHEP